MQTYAVTVWKTLEDKLLQPYHGGCGKFTIFLAPSLFLQASASFLAPPTAPTAQTAQTATTAPTTKHLCFTIFTNKPKTTKKATKKLVPPSARMDTRDTQVSSLSHELFHFFTKIRIIHDFMYY
jgi:hypothetical protein